MIILEKLILKVKYKDTKMRILNILLLTIIKSKWERMNYICQYNGVP